VNLTRRNISLTWLADDTMYYAAMAGSGIGADAYDEVPLRMSRPPKDQMEAYEQAVFFVALATRRAIQLEDEGVISHGVKAPLQQELSRLGAEGAAAKSDTNILCATTGYWCPVRGSGQVLADTIEIIEGSGLPDQERVRMTTILRKSKQAVMLRQALPWLALAGVGGAVGIYWFKFRRV
jgi:hypothetical protein